MSISRKLLGKRLFSGLMKSTFYGHFVAGQDQNDIRSNVEKMMKYGVKSILDYSAEEDLETIKKVDDSNSSLDAGVTIGNRKLVDPSEIQCEKNTKIFLNCIDAVSDVTSATGIAAVKLTSLIRPDLLLKLSSYVSKIIDHNKTISQNTIDKDIFSWKQLISKNSEEFALVFNGINEIKDSTGEKIEFSEKDLNEIKNMLLRIDEIVEV